MYVYIKIVILYNFICKKIILLKVCYDAQFLGLVSKAQWWSSGEVFITEKKTLK